MIQETLNFTTTFNLALSTPKFKISDTTNYVAEGISLVDVVGVVKIEGPSGIIYENTNFASPDIDANVSLDFSTVSIPLDTSGNPIYGDYSVTYTIRVSGGVQPGDYLLSKTYKFCYVKPTGSVEVTSDIDCAIVTSTDNTTYAVSGVNPVISRVNDLYYPANLELPKVTGSTTQVSLSYPNVYTGTYTGKITTTATYTFPDSLIVIWSITAVDETVVDNETLCDIYCGLKRLTNEYLTAKDTGDFGLASKLDDKLSIIALLQNLYYEGKRCGEDVSVWLENIIKIANVTPGCGCDEDSPVQVIPFCGVTPGSGTTVVAGDSSFGTQVSSSTVGTTTTYTVRLTDTYKNLILNALQSQDLSVSAFRAAGIPVGARGASVVTIPSGGGSLSLVAGTSKNTLVLKGTGTLTSGYTVSTSGTPINGDYFIVQYEGGWNLDGNNITIFGKQLSQQEASAGNLIVITTYSSDDSAWHTNLVTRGGSSTSIPSSITVWESGADFAVGDLKLYNSPALLYKCIVASGSGSTAPPTTPTNNANWQYVGTGSALFSGSGLIVIDTTTGEIQISTPATTTVGSKFILFYDPSDNKIKKIADTTYLTSSLTNGYILLGNGSNVATPSQLTNALLRTLNLPYGTGKQYLTIALAGATINLTAGTKVAEITGSGSVTGAYQVNLPSTGNLEGDIILVSYRATCTIGGGSIAVGSIGIPGSLTGSGDLLFICTYGSLGWSMQAFAGLSSFGFIAGTNASTVRYNTSGQLVEASNLRNTGSLVESLSGFSVGRTAVPNVNIAATSVAVGSGNNLNSIGDLFVAGELNVATQTYSYLFGRANQGGGLDAIAAGFNNITGGIGTQAFGYENISNKDYSIVTGRRGQSLRNSSHTIATRSNTGALDYGQVQESDSLATCDTTDATATVMLADGRDSNARLFIPSGYTIGIRGQIIARQTGGSSGTVGDSAYFPVDILAKNVGGTVSFVGTSTVTNTKSDAGASSWTITAVANSVLQCIDFTVTGQANKNIRWVAGLTIAETKA